MKSHAAALQGTDWPCFVFDELVNAQTHATQSSFLTSICLTLLPLRWEHS